MRVPSYLTDQRVPFETLVHPPAFTASRRAGCLHVPGKQLAKCVLLVGPTCRVGPAGDKREGAAPNHVGSLLLPGRQDLLAIVPATHHVDLDQVAINIGRQMRLAQCEEIAEIFRDCEWGGLVPFGSLYGLQTLLDSSFEPEDVLVFEAHQHAVAIRMRCRDFERLEKPRRFAFAK